MEGAVRVTWSTVGGKSYRLQTNAPPASGSFTPTFADFSPLINNRAWSRRIHDQRTPPPATTRCGLGRRQATAGMQNEKPAVSLARG